MAIIKRPKGPTKEGPLAAARTAAGFGSRAADKRAEDQPATGETIGRRATAAELDLTGLNNAGRGTPITPGEIIGRRATAAELDVTGLKFSPGIPYPTSNNRSLDGSWQYETPEGELHYVSATGVDTILKPGTAVKITAADLTSFVVGGGQLLKMALSGIASMLPRALLLKLLGQNALGTTASTTIGPTGFRIGLGITQANALQFGGKAAVKAGAYATNTVTKKLTVSWLVSHGFKAATATTLLTAIGSYPFAYFIKEEALQAIKGSYTGAMIAKNYEQAQLAIDERNEILNPGPTERILMAIPIANTVKQLLDLFETGRTAVEIDQKVLDDIKTAILSGDSEEDQRRKAKEEEIEMNKVANEERIQLQKEYNQNKRNADAAAAASKRAEDKKFYEEQSRFWQEQADLTRQKEAEDRLAIAKFWLEYQKAKQVIADNNRPSNLNFGLLR